MRIINADKYLLWFIILLTFTKIMFERQNYIHTSTNIYSKSVYGYTYSSC